MKIVQRRGCWQKCPECGAPEGMWCDEKCIFRTQPQFSHSDLGVFERLPDEPKESKP